MIRFKTCKRCRNTFETYKKYARYCFKCCKQGRKPAHTTNLNTDEREKIYNEMITKLKNGDYDNETRV